MNMPPRGGLRFFAIGSTKIPLLTQLEMMNAIPADEFTHERLLQPQREGQGGRACDMEYVK